MILGLVSGTLTATHRDPKLEGVILLAIQELDLTLTPTGNHLIVADRVGAGPGDLVLIAKGGAALYTDATSGRPIDAVAVAIVERVQFG